MVNQELFNRIFHTAQSIINQYMFEPLDARTENDISTRIGAQLEQLRTRREISAYVIDTRIEGSTLLVDIQYKQPNIANMINIDISIGPSISNEDRFDRAMKGI